MNLLKLTIDERQAFLLLSKGLSYADGQFSEEESHTLNALCVEMGIIDTGEEFRQEDIKNICKTFNTNTSKLLAIAELISLAIIDGKIKHKEMEFLDNVREIFNVKRNVFDELEKWAIQRMKLNEDIMQITTQA